MEEGLEVAGGVDEVRPREGFGDACVVKRGEDGGGEVNSEFCLSR